MNILDVLGSLFGNKGAAADPLTSFLNGQWTPMIIHGGPAHAHYDDDNQMLTIEYKDGATWTYAPVTLWEATDFLAAGSKGTWLWDNVRIRGTKHQHQKSAVKIL